MRHRLFVVSGPSGSGKTTLCHAWLARASRLRLSISCTTRRPRRSEEEGREYHFLDRQAFENLKREGAFLEWAKVHGNYYGTRAADVDAMLAGGFDVLLEIDWQGAAQVAEKRPDCCRIFILPPSLDVLRQRLNWRSEDDTDVIEHRLAAAQAEMAHAGEADYQIVNDDFDKALDQLLALYRSP